MPSPMPKMLAYSIYSSARDDVPCRLCVGVGADRTWMSPAHAQNDSYWMCVINGKNPREKVKEWIVPGTSHSTVPPGIDTYMNDPDHLYVLTTKTLQNSNLPQGDFYNFLAKYGAGRELQKLMQIYAVTQGTQVVTYVLTGHCGPRMPGKPAPQGYEAALYVGEASLLLSLMSMPNGGPPWGICESYTWTNPPAS